jgi:hypothetical protein
LWLLLARVAVLERRLPKGYMNKNSLKSIGAVLASFIMAVFLSFATDWVLLRVGIFPIGEQGLTEQGLYVPWMLVLALLYRDAYTVLGGYVTARLAPQNHMKHVIALGIVATGFSIVSMVVGWNSASHWYSIALAATAFPCVWSGGTLYKPQTQTSRVVVKV